MRCILLFVLLISFSKINAQDTLWVFQRFQKPYIRHKVLLDESIFTISRLYSVPLAILANENHKNYQEGIKAGQELWIPLDQNNFLQTETENSQPLFYTVKDGDDLRTIARMSGVTQSTLQKWNNLHLPQVTIGKVLKIGWAKYDRVHIPISNYKQSTINDEHNVEKNETKVTEQLTNEKLIAEFNLQTGGKLIESETGAASFYPVKTKLDTNTFYAMHKTALRGTIIEVTNPATGKTIYARVVGKLPMLPEYQNSIIALSNNAANPLGANDTKIFCKITYAK